MHISSTWNTRFGPQDITEVLRVLEIMVGVIFFHIPVGVTTWARGVEGRLVGTQVEETTK